jgi:hypothetical protein
MSDVASDVVAVEVVQAENLTTSVLLPAGVGVCTGVLSAEDAREDAGSVTAAAGLAVEYTAAAELRYPG